MPAVKKPTRAGHPDLALLHQELSQLIGRLVEFDRADRAGLGEWMPNVDVFECHGTSTVVGDKVEVEALTELIGTGRRGARGSGNSSRRTGVLAKTSVKRVSRWPVSRVTKRMSFE